jgi:hypothetical protein
LNKLNLLHFCNPFKIRKVKEKIRDQKYLENIKMHSAITKFICLKGTWSFNKNKNIAQTLPQTL